MILKDLRCINSRVFMEISVERRNGDLVAQNGATGAKSAEL